MNQEVEVGCLNYVCMLNQGVEMWCHNWVYILNQGVELWCHNQTCKSKSTDLMSQLFMLNQVVELWCHNQTCLYQRVQSTDVMSQLLCMLNQVVELWCYNQTCLNQRVQMWCRNYYVCWIEEWSCDDTIILVYQRVEMWWCHY